DIGSGAGFPGIVLAAMLPQAKFTLIEPMERRVDWLEEVVGELGLENVKVVRNRAEDYPHKGSFDIVVCRAVARLAKLVPWAMPLVRPGGRVIALKGQSAQQEIDKAAKEIRKAHGLNPMVHGAPVGQGLEPTFVVTIDKRARR
ncbi:MAG: 16S rRNA (guanine(527)-N(7))-methyltransferase RsmG, partial [Aeriscardovia sp.]|nr:16S rRNA (guanine(527)-N(7))-methyltransferase RsmG [Aeriscardovia sp.]